MPKFTDSLVGGFFTVACAIGLIWAASLLEAPETKPTIAVIGCGIAGLEAMKKLVSSGHFNVIGLEARDRIGGRLYTDEEKDDFGAAWIHGDFRTCPITGEREENPVYVLAQQLGAETVPTNAFHVVQSDGTVSESANGDVWEHMWRALNFIKTHKDAKSNAYTPCAVSVRDFMRANWASLVDEGGRYSEVEVVKAIIEWQSYYACNWETTSLGSMALDSEYEGSQLLIKGGYETILSHYRQLLGEKIRLNTPVSKIERIDEKARITFGEEVLVVDDVIVTVPLGVLKSGSIEFVPPLPSYKTDAINRLGFGVYDKVFVAFDRPIESDKGGFWPVDVDTVNIVPKGNDDYHEYLFATSRECESVDSDTAVHRPYYERDPEHIGIEAINLSQIAKVPKLVMLIYGDAAMRMEAIAHDQEALKAFALSKLRNAFPSHVIPTITKVKATTWGSDPYSLGSFANVPVGSSGRDMYALAEPVDDWLFFGGEAAFPEHYSTVHGAMKSGIREYVHIMNKYSFAVEEEKYQRLVDVPPEVKHSSSVTEEIE